MMRLFHFLFRKQINIVDAAQIKANDHNIDHGPLFDREDFR